ncbi:MAG: GGDEF domain-containing protein [Planctomycetes bacterium]|nr:GGDEF domain-containing protein [Planctomycetota bacterium]
MRLRPLRGSLLVSLLASGISLSMYHAISSRDTSTFAVSLIAATFGLIGGGMAGWLLLLRPCTQLEKRWMEYLRRLRAFRYQSRSDSYDHLKLDEPDLLGQTSREVHRMIVDSYAHYAEAARLRRTMDDAIRVQVARATAHLDRLAHTDALTDIPNRRAIEAALPSLLESCRARSTEIVAILVDADHMHVLNDHCGRDAGDDMLIRLAASLRSVLRESDLAFRYGGGCFLVLFQDLEPHQVHTVVRRISRHFIQVTRIWSEKKSGWKPSLSVGAASLRQSRTSTSESYLGEALIALQRAKNQGGGRFCCSWKPDAVTSLDFPDDRSNAVRMSRSDNAPKPNAA